MDPQGMPPHDEMLAQTLESINDATVSQGRFADLCYPPDLTRRIADRVLRESFERTFRVVPAMRPMRGSSSESVHRRELDLEHPSRRGANALDIDLETDYFTLAQEVGAMLARDGVVHAACHAVRSKKVDPDEAHELLFNVGIPTDLLAHVLGQARELDGEQAAAGFVAGACAATRSAKQASERLMKEHAPRAWTPSVDGATLRSDAGDAPHSAAIVALARADYLFAPGDGGALDHVRACVHALAPTPIIALAMDPLRARTLLEAPNAHVVPCGHAPAQFVRDAIAVLDRPTGSSAALIPRFPSRGEIGTPFAPNILPDTLYGLNKALHAVNPAHEALHSPLHFHGGDILCWRDGDGAHVMVGEGTIARNTAIGLTPAQVRDALAREFNAVELIVLPAATFHIDTCVSVLNTPQGPAFLIADPMAAASAIIEEACDRLCKAGVMSPATTRQVGDALARRNEPSNARALELLGEHAMSPFAAPGAPPLAAVLAPADPDGGAASAMRFLHALDLLASQSGAIPVPPDVGAYLDSLRRAMGDLEALRAKLQPFARIVPLAAGITGAPALPAANMVHLASGITLLPTFAGVCSRADTLNQAVLERTLGRRVARIPAGESAIRQGATRCSLVLLG